MLSILQNSLRVEYFDMEYSKKLIGDRIGKFALEEYAKLDSKFKPVRRSNGSMEWTVLAAIVGIDSELNLKLICLTTGVKATPDTDLHRSKGKILHDCHAEILALRSFNTILLQEMIQIKQGNSSDLLLSLPTVEASGDYRPKYRFNKKWKLALYVSKLPCGDASMDSLEEFDIQTNSSQNNKIPKVDKELNDKLVNMTDDDPIQYISPKVKHILRGRFNFSKKGYVRTKPGRMDSKITYSKSCSDKLAMKQVTSILNNITWSLLEDPIYLDYLVIPNIKDNSSQSSLKRCFRERLSDSIHPVHHLEILNCNATFPDDISQEKQTSLASFVKLNYTNIEPQQQIILNGLKNGFYTKPTKPLRKNCQSHVSRWDQFDKYHKLIGLETSISIRSRSYSSFKKSQEGRLILVKDTKELLTKGDAWIQTNVDDDFILS